MTISATAALVKQDFSDDFNVQGIAAEKLIQALEKKKTSKSKKRQRSATSKELLQKKGNIFGGP